MTMIMRNDDCDDRVTNSSRGSLILEDMQAVGVKEGEVKGRSENINCPPQGELRYYLQFILITLQPIVESCS